MTSQEIRESFFKFFEERGHRRLPSASLIPINDPTLLFTNAGMVPFKEFFLGERTPDFRRVATVQKCVRAGGKHNDLEQVGRTSRHQTFFEMLGNFSFGDYFKKEAIAYAWAYVREGLQLPKESLFISVFEKDDEGAKLWQDVAKVEEQRIYRFGEKENFWAMGDRGPCGPCSEIFADLGPKFGCGKKTCRVGCPCGRFLEVWNLVFMQYDRTEEGGLSPLPKPSIDTGMGLERIASVVQGVGSNFETDLFHPIFAGLEEFTGKKYKVAEVSDFSLCVIADHIRTAVFLISEGVLPSNEGRGYVLRRILRRAIRHGKLLGKAHPFLHQLSSVVIDTMQGFYPELRDKGPFVDNVIYHEEERFLATLSDGMRLLESEFRGILGKKKKLSGDIVFKLYDTFGFPPDLTEIIAGESKVSIDWEGFEKAMGEQREKARKSWVGEETKVDLTLYDKVLKKVGSNQFVGYETLKTEAPLTAILAEGKALEQIEGEVKVELIFSSTPFYAEAGGQVGDKGVIEGAGVFFEVEDTQSPVAGLIVHKGVLKKGKLKVGTKYQLAVNGKLRAATVKNHTATHLLHHVLREILGKHVKQAGSLVAPDRLRFDYTHFAPLSHEEIERVEQEINEKIHRNDSVQARTTTYHQALEEGVIAFFGERYGEKVRVIDAGGYSKELCGGTHAHSTGEIGLFKIITDSSLASGVRRMEAVTGEKAVEYLFTRDRTLGKIEEILGARAGKVIDRTRSLLEEERRLTDRLKEFSKKKAEALAVSLIGQAQKIEWRGKTIGCVVERVEMEDGEALRAIADRIRLQIKPSVVVLAAVREGKAVFVSGITEDLKGVLHAGNLVGEIAKKVGGSGGGKETLAQAGGGQVENLEEALAFARKRIKELLQK